MKCEVPPCTEPGCDRPSWSAGLCRSHYKLELRCRHTYQSPARNGNGDYDVRFCNLFVDELEQLGFPRYPEPHWFGALRRADAEFKDLGPQLSLKPQLCGSEGIRATGVRGPRPENKADLGRVVDAACTQWLRARGLYREQQGIRF